MVCSKLSKGGQCYELWLLQSCEDSLTWCEICKHGGERKLCEIVNEMQLTLFLLKEQLILCKKSIAVLKEERCVY